MRPLSLSEGHHTHAETELSNPGSLVKTDVSEPTIIVKPDEFREIIVRFTIPQPVILFSVQPTEYFESHQVLFSPE